MLEATDGKNRVGLVTLIYFSGGDIKIMYRFPAMRGSQVSSASFKLRGLVDVELDRLPPNGTLCLNRWGLKTLLDKYSLKFMKYSYNHCEGLISVSALCCN